MSLTETLKGYAVTYRPVMVKTYQTDQPDYDTESLADLPNDLTSVTTKRGIRKTLKRIDVDPEPWYFLLVRKGEGGYKEVWGMQTSMPVHTTTAFKLK